MASLFARRNKKTQQNQDRTKMADNDLKREYKAGAIVERQAIIEETMKKQRTVPDEHSPAHVPYVPPAWMSHRTVSSPSLPATERNGTAWDDEPVNPDAERRALLKRQLADLKARGL